MGNIAEYTVKSQPKRAGEQEVKKLAYELGVHQIVAELLCQRGYSEAEHAKGFLAPRLAGLPSPSGLKGVNEAVSLIHAAVVSKWQVVVHGDYDVDGITGTALLVEFLEKLGLDVIYHLPNRLKEGYGLNPGSLTELAQKVSMPALLITVDCGISASKEIQYSKDLGFKVIVTDHHEPPSDLPPADAIINPKQKGCGFEGTDLSGVGVAFFLAMAVRSKMIDYGFWDSANMPNLKESLDLVALGTVADVVDLVGVNRILVKGGLEVITARKRPGIWALCDKAGIEEGGVTSEHISFALAPRINAAGRLGDPNLAARLLLCNSINIANEAAVDLDRENKKRREIEKKVLKSAVAMAQEQVDNNRKGLVLLGKDWHPGVIGIIAAKVCDLFERPVLVFSEEQDGGKKTYKGSGRSVEGLNLVLALESCEKHLIQFGGHAMAAGLTVYEEDYDQFFDAFDRHIGVMMREIKPKRMEFDIKLNDKVDCEAMVNSLKLMEPFGSGNPEPVFLLKGVRMRGLRVLRDHLKFNLNLNGCHVQGIGFFMADKISDASGSVDLGFKLKETRFRGKRRIEAHAVMINPSS